MSPEEFLLAVRSNTVMINRINLRRLLQEKGIQQKDIAAQVGINRNTVRRWLKGEVKWARANKVYAISAILDCPLNHLIQQTPSATEPTPQERAQAASALNISELSRLATQEGDYELMEKLLLVLRDPILPPQRQGEIFNELALACAQQNKLNQATKYLDLAKSLHLQFDLPEISAKATSLEALIALESGYIQEAITINQQAIATNKEKQNKQNLIRNLADLAMCWSRYGKYDQSLAYSQKALELTSQQHISTKDFHFFATIWLVRSENWIEKGKYREAADALAKSMQYAKEIAFRYGIRLGTLQLALVKTLTGNNKEGESILRQWQEKYRTPQNMHDLIFLSWTWRTLGQPRRSIEAIEKFHQNPKPNAYYSGRLLIEKALNYRDLQLKSESKIIWQHALRQLGEAGAEERIKRYNTFSDFCEHEEHATDHNYGSLSGHYRAVMENNNSSSTPMTYL